MPPYNASDPTARFVSASCLDFLLIELVPMAYRLTNELEIAARQQENEAAAVAAAVAVAGEGEGEGADGEGGGGAEGVEGADGEGVAEGDGVNGAGVIQPPAGLGSAVVAGGAGGTGAETETVMDEEDERGAVFWRLERIGYRVGQGLVERYVCCCVVGWGRFLPSLSLPLREVMVLEQASSYSKIGGIQGADSDGTADSPATGHASTTRWT